MSITGEIESFEVEPDGSVLLTVTVPSEGTREVIRADRRMLAGIAEASAAAYSLARGSAILPGSAVAGIDPPMQPDPLRMLQDTAMDTALQDSRGVIVTQDRWEVLPVSTDPEVLSVRPHPHDDRLLILQAHKPGRVHLTHLSQDGPDEIIVVDELQLDHDGVDRRLYERPVCGNTAAHGHHTFQPIGGLTLSCAGAL